MVVLVVRVAGELLGGRRAERDLCAGALCTAQRLEARLRACYQAKVGGYYVSYLDSA